MGYFAGRKKGYFFMPKLALDFQKVPSIDRTLGQSNYTGTGVIDAYFSIGSRGTPKAHAVKGGIAGFQTHLTQSVLMSAATNILVGFYATVSHGNVISTNGELLGCDLYARNAGTGTVINLTGGRFMVYSASGATTKYKKGLLVDVLDMASSHPSGGGTQGITIQLNPTSIVNNQVDAILINQNSAQTIASGIVFKGKMGASNGNHAVLNFVGSGDGSDNEGNKQILIKIRSGGTTYTVTPAQFLTVLGANCTAI